MVPLSNAHDSGAWQWSADQREQYANYLDDPQHLIAVTASANRSKGVRGPERVATGKQVPLVQYAIDWITIKETWDLTVTQAEHDALAEMLNTCAMRPTLLAGEPARTGIYPAEARINFHTRTNSCPTCAEKHHKSRRPRQPKGNN